MNKSERKLFPAWVTKYALTEGIFVVDAEWCNDISEGMICYGKNASSFAHGKDWHRTPEAALARAEEMRLAKIETAKKQIAKLESMTFSAPVQTS